MTMALMTIRKAAGQQQRQQQQDTQQHTPSLSFQNTP
jgi:hypothetical protein